jgi:hypothetical protein
MLLLPKSLCCYYLNLYQVATDMRAYEQHVCVCVCVCACVRVLAYVLEEATDMRASEQPQFSLAA